MGGMAGPAGLVCDRCLDTRAKTGICLGPRGVRRAKTCGVHNTCCGVDALASRREDHKLVATSTKGRTRNITFTTGRFKYGTAVIVPAIAPLVGMGHAGDFKTSMMLRNSICSSTCTCTYGLTRRGKCAFIRPFGSLSITANRKAVTVRVIRRLPAMSCVLTPVNKNKLVANISALTGVLGPGVGMVNMRPSRTTDVATTLGTKRPMRLPSTGAVTSKATMGRIKSGIIPCIGRGMSSVLLMSSSRLVNTFLSVMRGRGVVMRGSNLLSMTTLGRVSVGKGGMIYMLDNKGVSIVAVSSVIRRKLVRESHVFSMSMLLPSGPNRLTHITRAITSMRNGVVGLRRGRFMDAGEGTTMRLHVAVRTFKASRGGGVLSALSGTKFEPGLVDTGLCWLMLGDL